uniref:SH2 domain-containing protein n=1 Tax=Gadus morhua TaxID=8049 RepID=A0A8C4Z1R0_GADMO
MAVAGCPDYFMHHPNYQDKVDHSTNHRQTPNLIGPSFEQSTNRNSPHHHQEDDVDLEALVNGMNSSLESLYSSSSGQHGPPHLSPEPSSSSSSSSDSSQGSLRRSQPMHILAVRRLQEEQLRTSSLPAIPNPFPELCSPAGSPVLSPGSLPPGDPPSGTSVSQETPPPSQMDRSVSENSLVAMDFSGRIGRVIKNPLEAQSAAMEEGHAWRKRSQRLNVLGCHSPLHHSSLSSGRCDTLTTMPVFLWFHGRITREESHRIIHQQGQVDGLFLLRVSQSNPKAFVLTLCHHQKIKHFQILPCEEDGQIFFSLDDGSTKFTDLIQLVEFYQLNKGVLPCKLRHPCTFVAL